MSRRDDLIQHIRASYALIREYEEKIAFSKDPQEKAHDRRAMEEQWALVRGWLAELRRLGGALPADIADLDAAPPGPAASREPADGAKYEVHIHTAQGVAIGDGARVEAAGAERPAGGKGE